MIQGLENMFGEFGNVAKSDALLHDPQFVISVVNLQKTFDELFARFIPAIAPLDFRDCQKISNHEELFVNVIAFRLGMTQYTSY